MLDIYGAKNLNPDHRPSDTASSAIIKSKLDFFPVLCRVVRCLSVGIGL